MALRYDTEPLIPEDGSINEEKQRPVYSHQTLASLRIFWSVLWLAVVELIILVCVIILEAGAGKDANNQKKIICILIQFLN
jgi:hypothetical protein